MSDKKFTLQEAERLLPKIEQIVSGLMENKRSANQIGQGLAILQEKARRGDKTVQATEMLNKQTELEFILGILQEGVDSIEELGAQMKDLDLGLVDFPSVLNGEEVLLCWKYGEKKIQYFHSLTDGYAGRKLLP